MDAVDSPSSPDGHAADSLATGTRVEVRNGFDRSWSNGFVVIGHTAGGYRLRRRSDDVELPGTFTEDDVRRERKRSTWWV